MSQVAVNPQNLCKSTQFQEVGKIVCVQNAGVQTPISTGLPQQASCLPGGREQGDHLRPFLFREEAPDEGSEAIHYALFGVVSLS